MILDFYCYKFLVFDVYKLRISYEPLNLIQITWSLDCGQSTEHLQRALFNQNRGKYAITTYSVFILKKMKQGGIYSKTGVCSTMVSI